MRAIRKALCSIANLTGSTASIVAFIGSYTTGESSLIIPGAIGLLTSIGAGCLSNGCCLDSVQCCIECTPLLDHNQHLDDDNYKQNIEPCCNKAAACCYGIGATLLLVAGSSVIATADNPYLLISSIFAILGGAAATARVGIEVNELRKKRTVIVIRNPTSPPSDPSTTNSSNENSTQPLLSKDTSAQQNFSSPIGTERYYRSKYGSYKTTSDEKSDEEVVIIIEDDSNNNQYVKKA